ncbi:biotin carboxylase N-terminal domain-containing protein [Arthrobacter alkaliphilus]|uniref:biotin carboxylase N-terminal domain-containing protein n=1 Tax=Arthrobacter alkaliphilus TaxID=369936 RepID=UPI00355919FD
MANRGEIGPDIIRACNQVGIAAVTAHYEANADFLPLKMADHGVGIGLAEVVEGLTSPSQNEVPEEDPRKRGIRWRAIQRCIRRRTPGAKTSRESAGAAVTLKVTP